MPKRLVDGEALWSSDKLLRVPDKYRSEYANLIPLALANGVFECHVAKVWRLAYSYNRPEVTQADVTAMLNAFEEAKMLFRWTAPDGKTWGFWVGINKGHRLPPPSRSQDEKRGPDVPVAELEAFLNQPYDIRTDDVRNPLTGEDRDRRGLGEEGRGAEPTPAEDSTMKIESEIRVICYKTLGLREPLWPDTVSELKILAAAYGRDVVVRDFSAWAGDHQGETLNGRPLSEYLKTAAGRLAGIIATIENPALDKLIGDMVFAAHGDVLFDDKAKAEIAKLLKTNSSDDILSAFRTFYSKIEGDPFLLKQAARAVANSLIQLLDLAKRERQEREKAAALMAQQKQALQAEVAVPPQADPEESLIEDQLGG